MSTEFESSGNETDEVLVAFLPTEMLERLRLRDESAIDQARKMLDGVVIYDHAFSTPPDEVWSPVTLGELEFFRVIRSVTLNLSIP